MLNIIGNVFDQAEDIVFRKSFLLAAQPDTTEVHCVFLKVTSYELHYFHLKFAFYSSLNVSLKFSVKNKNRKKNQKIYVSYFFVFVPCFFYIKNKAFRKPFEPSCQRRQYNDNQPLTFVKNQTVGAIKDILPFFDFKQIIPII